jgi:hypothetical protein
VEKANVDVDKAGIVSIDPQRFPQKSDKLTRRIRSFSVGFHSSRSCIPQTLKNRVLLLALVAESSPVTGAYFQAIASKGVHAME